MPEPESSSAPAFLKEYLQVSLLSWGRSIDKTAEFFPRDFEMTPLKPFDPVNYILKTSCFKKNTYLPKEGPIVTKKEHELAQ